MKEKKSLLIAPVPPPPPQREHHGQIYPDRPAKRQCVDRNAWVDTAVKALAVIADYEQACPICTKIIDPEGKWCVLECDHILCYPCTRDAYLGTATNCPSCKRTGALAPLTKLVCSAIFTSKELLVEAVIVEEIQADKDYLFSDVACRRDLGSVCLSMPGTSKLFTKYLDSHQDPTDIARAKTLLSIDHLKQVTSAEISLIDEKCKDIKDRLDDVDVREELLKKVRINLEKELLSCTLHRSELLEVLARIIDEK